MSHVPKTSHEDRTPWGTFTGNLHIVPKANSREQFRRKFLCLSKYEMTHPRTPRVLAAPRGGRSTFFFARLRSAGGFYYEKCFANLIIIIRFALQAVYREFLSELPIRSILHREIVLTMKTSFTLRAYLTMKTSFTLRVYLMIKITSIAR